MQETKLADADAPVMPFRWPATSCSTTARAAGTASRSPHAADRCADRRGHELRRRAGPRQRPARRGRRMSARRTSTRSTRRGWSSAVVDGIASSACTRPNGRVVGLAVLRRQAGLVRTRSRAGSPRRATPGRAAGRRRRPQRRADAMPTCGTRPRPTAARTCREPERAALPSLLDWGSSTATAPNRPEPGALLVVGLPRRQCSTRTSACASTTCCSSGRLRRARRVGRDRPRGAQGRAQSRPTTRRSSSTSTSRACRSTPAGRARLERIAARTRPAGPEPDGPPPLRDPHRGTAGSGLRPLYQPRANARVDGWRSGIADVERAGRPGRNYVHGAVRPDAQPDNRAGR